MPRPRTDSTDPAVIRRREYRERKRLGLVVVMIGPERLDMHADDAATLYDEAREMQRERLLDAAMPDKKGNGMKFLEGNLAPFRTAADRKALVGKRIRYLRGCDIDKTGRGYFFPRIDTVVDAKGTQLMLDSGDSLHRGDLREIVVLGDPI